MEVSRLYKKEKQFVIMIYSLIFILILGAVALIFFKNRTSPFERAMAGSDYKTLYKYIKNPEFSEGVFGAYINYNYGKSIEIIEKTKSKDAIEYKVKGTNGVKNIKLFKENNKFIWNFDDFTHNWGINVSEGASVFIEDQEYKSKEGLVLIEKIPFGVYNLKAKLQGCSDYEMKIMSGQNINIAMEISKDTIYSCNTVVKDYLTFKEKALNTRQVGEVDCLSKDSGLYKEMLQEVEWLKKQDFKSERKLISFEIKKGIIQSGKIILDVYEKWDTKVTTDENQSTKIEEYNNRYVISQGEKYIINQIKTINQ